MVPVPAPERGAATAARLELGQPWAMIGGEKMGMELAPVWKKWIEECFLGSFVEMFWTRHNCKHKS